MPGKPHILSVFPTHLINSIKLEHLCKILFFSDTCHPRIQKVFSEGVQLFFKVLLLFFSLLGERGSKSHNKRAIIGPPSSAECWLVSFVVLHGIGPILLRNPIFL